MIYKAKSDTNCKTNRQRKNLEKLLDGTRTLREISELVNMSESSLRNFSTINNLSYKRRYLFVGNIPFEKTLEHKIYNMLIDGFSYVKIAKKFKVSTKSLQTFAHSLGIRRYNKQKKAEFINTISIIREDIKNGIEYDELVKKYNITDNVRSELYRHGLEPIFRTFKTQRDKSILDEYKKKIAKSLLTNSSADLNNPRKIKTEHHIYRISSQQGFVKFPGLKDKNKGGSFEDPKIIKFILKKRDVDNWTFSKISDELNSQNKKTIMGTEFKAYLVRYKYLKNKL